MLLDYLTGRPEEIQPPFIFIRLDETDIVISGDFPANPVFYILIQYDTLFKRIAYVLVTGSAGFQAFLDDTCSHRAVLIDQLWIFRHAAVADDIGRIDPKTKVSKPAVA